MIGLLLVLGFFALPSVSGVTVCSDGSDNDLDSLTDFPEDPGCEDADEDRHPADRAFSRGLRGKHGD